MKTEELTAQIKGLTEENEILKQENAWLSGNNNTLTNENEKLRDDEILLKIKIRNLEKERKETSKEIDNLKNLVNSKSGYICELRKENRRLLEVEKDENYIRNNI